MTTPLWTNVTGVAVDGRAVVVEGEPGSGKSTLALELIDRGAVLIGDDAVALERRGAGVFVHPPPRLAGSLEIRGVGIVSVPTGSAPLALIVTLGTHAPRLPDGETRTVEGVEVPVLAFEAAGRVLALRVECALRSQAGGAR